MAGVPTFAVDRSLGRLAIWLRRLGFDTVSRADLDRHRLETLAAREGRVLVTRTQSGQRTPARVETLFLRADRFRDQLREIDDRHPLGGWQDRGARCLACNAAAPGGARRRERCRRCRTSRPSRDHDARMERELRALSLRASDAL